MSDVERRPAGAMSRERRFGIAISTGLILGGGWWALSELGSEAAPADRLYAATGTQLVIRATSAELEIRAGDGAEIQVHRTGGSDGLFSDGPKESYAGSELEVRSGSCPSVTARRSTSWWCRASSRSAWTPTTPTCTPRA